MFVLTSLLRASALLAVLTVFLAACSAEDRSPAGSNNLPGAFNAELPGLSSPEREVSALNFGSRLGDEVYDKSAAAIPHDVTHQLLMNPGDSELVWAIYQLGPFAAGDELVHIFVSPNIDPDPPATYYIALADYATGRWRMQEVSPSDGDDWVAGISQAEPSTSFSPGGFAYIAVLAWDEVPLTINEVGWNYNSVDNVSNVQASDGTSMDEIRISWDPVTDATGYQLFYYEEGDSPDDRLLLAEPDGGTTEFIHSETSPPGMGSQYGVTYFYEMKASFADGSLSPQFSIAESGYRLLPTPQNFIATDGYSPSLIQLSWDSVPVADGYSIFRDGVFLKSIPEADVTTTLDDDGEVVLGLVDHAYHIIAFQGALESLPSPESTGSLADWRITDIGDVIDATAAVEAANFLDKPVAAYYDEPEVGDLYGASFIRTDSMTPGSGADFDHHFFDSLSDGAGQDLSLAIIGGLPAVALWNKSDGGLYFARATLSAPGSDADWQIHLALADYANPGVSLSVSGLFTPVIVSCNIDTVSPDPEVPNGLQIGISTGVPFPASAEDWTWHSVDADVEEIDDSVLLADGGRLISYIVRSDDGGQVNDLRVASPLSFPSSWDTYSVDSASEVTNSLAMQLINGTPWILYADNADPGASVRLARASVAEPAAPADFELSTLLTPFPAGSQQVHDLSLITLGGKPAFMASLHEFTAGEQFIYIMRSKVDDPLAASDWFGANLSFDAPFHGDASLTSLANGLPAMFYVDTDDALNWQLRYFHQAAQ